MNTPTTPDNPITIVRGGHLTPQQRAGVVEVLCESFDRKIRKLLLLSKSGEQVRRILPAIIDFSQSFVALRGDKVCGILLMNLGGKGYLRFDWPLARREFGLLGAIYRRVNYAILDSDRREPDELNIQALAVLASCRSQGIGSRLLEGAEDLALADGYRLLSLEVIDSNRRAQSLYERYGFKTERTTNTWPYTHRAGFREYDYMVKHLVAKTESPLAGPHKPIGGRVEKPRSKR